MAPLLYDVVHKETFTNQLLALPSNAIPQVIKKIELLRTAPAPDAKNKKKLVGLKNPTFRLRFGDYRIIYTFSEAEGWVALLGVDARKDVYRNGELVDTRVTARVPGRERGRLGDEYTSQRQGSSDVDANVQEDRVIQTAVLSETVERIQPPQDVLLPRKITIEFLQRLRIEEQYHRALIACETLDELTMAAVPESVRERVFDALLEPNFNIVAEKPSLAVRDTSDFQRFYDGELVRFLLRLDDEQKRFVTWAVHGSGPALVKGGPGSGKTVVALYRVRALLEALRASGNHEPRILFTAYTNTLVTAARQMLRELLGDADADRVEVFTADKMAWDIADRAGFLPEKIIDDGQAMVVVKHAMDHLAGGSQDDQALVRAIASLNLPYILDEIDSVIVAREHQSLDSYLAQSRAGRGKRLTATQRQAIWRVHEECETSAQITNKVTWAQFRRRVVQLVRTGMGPAQYDGVLIDEAQDLQPTALRMLVALCKSKDRLFLTADPNQSIYGSGFRWADVHEDLQFRGRTGVLRTNYRSTQQIMAGAGSFLRGAELDEPSDAADCPRHGHRPVVHFYGTVGEQMQKLSDYFRAVTYQMHRGLSGCAVLTPTHKAGVEIAAWLTNQGQPATFMAQKSIKLDAPVIKVVPMKSAKGLEFPIVVLAGFSPQFPGPYPYAATDDQIQEIQLRERRTLYVGMTRAMESLLVLAPQNGMTLTEEVFDSALWEIEQGPQGSASVFTDDLYPPMSEGYGASQAGSR